MRLYDKYSLFLLLNSILYDIILLGINIEREVKIMIKIFNKTFSSFGKTMKKVVICVLTISLMMLPCMQAQAITGTNNILKINVVNFDGGSGHTEDTAFEINTIDQFLQFTENINNGNTYEGYYFKLGNDIDLKDEGKIKPIGSGNVDNETTYDKPTSVGNLDNKRVEFQGYFDGCGHSIINVDIGEIDRNYQGLFVAIGQKGTITRLIVDADVKGHQHIAIIAGRNEGIIKNCGTTATSSIYGQSGMGGIVGDNYGSVINCYNNADIISNNDWERLNASSGGIVGSGNIVKNCYNTGNITFTTGIKTSWGLISSTSVGLQNCYFDSAYNDNNGSGAGIGLSKSEMKSSLANTLNSTIGSLEENKICMWTQVQGEYPKLSNDFYVKTENISINSNISEIYFGETANLSATISPSNANNKLFTWQVINQTGKATINSAGLLTATKAGTVVVRAIANENSFFTDDININIVKRTLSNPRISVDEGKYKEKITLKLTSDENADIYYSIDYYGFKPIINEVKYVNPIELDTSARVYAYAKKENYNNSSIIIKNYTLEIPKINNVLIEGVPRKVYRDSNHVIKDEFSYRVTYQYLSGENLGITASIESKHDENTYIKDGILYISEKENADKIIFRMTSDYDNSKYCDVEIKINDYLKSIDSFSEIQNIKNGTKIDDIILPNTIKIIKAYNEKQSCANVVWDREHIVYDSDLKAAQSFEVNGQVVIPLGLDNKNYIDTNVKIKVNVLAENINVFDNKGGVSGIIKDSNNLPLSGANIRLTKGGSNKATLFEALTDNEGKYSFVNVPNGMYSLIAEKGSQIITKTILINNKNIVQNLNMPVSTLNTKLETNNGTPDIAADNLEKVVDITTENIEVKLVVNKKEENIAEGSSQIKAVLAADEHIDMFLDATLWSTINSGTPQTIQPKAGSKIKITIDVPSAIRGMKSYAIIRYHEGIAERLICDYDTILNTLSFETDKFSTYALVYEEKPQIYHDEVVVHEKVIVLPFEDISKNASYCKALEYMYDKKFISGTSETEFSPNLSTSRAMIVTILWRMEGKPVVDLDMKKYEDIDSNAYYIDAINWAISNEIIKGYSDTKLAPNDDITREQFAAILERYADYASKNTYARMDISSFEDNEIISNYATDSVNWMLAEKIMECDDFMIHPKDEAKRCEIVQMLYNFIK